MKTVVSTGGHGGVHPGAVHPPFVEKDLTLKLDMAFADAMERKYTGVRHVRVRTADVTVTLAERVAIAKREKADCFLEIHFNAGRGTGPETYVAKNYTAADLALAKAVHGKLYEYLGTSFNVPDRGIKKVDFYVLRETGNIPSILPEILFLDHPADRAAIQSPGFFDAAGEVLADGVAEFLGLPLKDNQLEQLKKENETLRQQYEAAQAQATEYRDQLRMIKAIINVT